VGEAVRSLRQGRALVSLGLLTRMTVDGRFRAGDLATGLGGRINVEVVVAGPSWTRADRVELFANGIKIREQAIDPSPDRVEKARVAWSIPMPTHDVHLVAIASGPGVTALYWPIARPYQPTSRVWESRVMGATNPVRIDADGDGEWTSPRGLAVSLVRKVGTGPEALLPALGSYDEAVAAQTAGLCLAAGGDLRSAEFEARLKAASEAVRRGFGAFLETMAGR
jgi:hypothetical protein